MTVDRFKLSQFRSGKASGIPHKVFRGKTGVANGVKHLRLSLLKMDFPPGTSMRQRKTIEQEWIQILPTLHNLQSLSIGHRANQELFESICQIPSLTRLEFHSSNVVDVSSITSLKKLERLELRGFSKLEDLSPITALENI